MLQEKCIICQRPRPEFHCGVCKEAVCKNCEHFLEPDHFSFLDVIPETLRLVHYCPTCFEAQVVPAQEKYDETMARAREVNIFFIADKHLPYLVRKAKKQVRIQDCKDRDEAILRLGFKAAEAGFNSVVKVEINSTQIRNLTHQKSSWHASGLLADIDVAKYFRNL